MRWGDRRLVKREPEGPTIAVWMSLIISGFSFLLCRPSNWHKTYRETLCQICSQQVDSDTVYSLTPLWILHHFPNPAETVNGPLPRVKHLPLEQNSLYKVCKIFLVQGHEPPASEGRHPVSTTHPRSEHTVSSCWRLCGVVLSRWFMGCFKCRFSVCFPLTFWVFPHALTCSIFYVKMLIILPLANLKTEGKCCTSY